MIYIVIVLVVFIAAWTGYEIGRAPLVEDVNEYGEPNEDTPEVEDIYFNDPAPPKKVAVKKISFRGFDGKLKEINCETVSSQEYVKRQNELMEEAIWSQQTPPIEPTLEELVRAEEEKRKTFITLDRMKTLFWEYKKSGYRSPSVYLVSPKVRAKLNNIDAWKEFTSGFWGERDIKAQNINEMTFMGVSVYTALELSEDEIRVI